MKRDIRYQAYYVDKFYDIEDMKLFANGAILPVKLLGFPDRIILDRIKCIRQFTEHKDSFKTEIWEGDIVTWKRDAISFLGEVFFDNKMYFGWAIRTAEGIIRMAEDAVRPEELHVIGNAMVSPEYVGRINKNNKKYNKKE